MTKKHRDTERNVTTHPSDQLSAEEPANEMMACDTSASESADAVSEEPNKSPGATQDTDMPMASSPTDVDDVQSADSSPVADESPSSTNADTQENTVWRAWQTRLLRFTDTCKPACRVIATLWRSRPKASYALYALIFTCTTIASTLILQWSVFQEPDSSETPDATTSIWESVAGRLTKFVAQIWLEHNKLFLLNALVIALLYCTVLFLINRFWIASAVILTASIVYAVANKCKVLLRNEPIIPADFSFITSGNTNELISFVPSDGRNLITTALIAIAGLLVAFIILQIIDGRKQFIPGRWQCLKTSIKHRIGVVVRLLAFLLSTTMLFSFCWNLSVKDSWAYSLAYDWQDRPVMSSAIADAQNNGTVISFSRLLHTDIMEEPERYSQAVMEKLAKKYSRLAEEINLNRNNRLTDSTVIMILSESFADPTRIPGLAFTQDPIPNIRQIETTTTSGLMLSSGYGGGTANIEYEALTGLSMSNYSPSLSSAYQQLVPNQQWAPSFNQLWNEEDGTGDSTALHSFFRNMYLRDTVYEKFGFSEFRTIDGSNMLENRDLLPGAIYVSDEASYDNVITQLESRPNENQFIHLVTMQNHMPYYDWGQGNVYLEGAVTGDIDETEREQISYYVNGLTFTDEATRDFIARLDQIDKPITVIWYGDHLPSVYATANADAANALTTHETDYFIWSNAASTSAGVKLDPTVAGITSPNYFMAIAANHMNAKVTPFIAFLTAMHTAIPAMAPASIAGAESTEPVYLDNAGMLLSESALSEEARELLNDYRLIQYDISAGKSYLNDTSFMSLQ